MLQISFGAQGTDPMDDIIKEVRNDDKLLKIKIEQLGTETELKMKSVIADHKVRPQAGEPTILENSITTDKFEDGWGVGDIGWLKHAAPFWAAINFGSSHMVGRRVIAGQFEPGTPQPEVSSFRQGRWKKGKGTFTFVAKNPILAMNYIEKTVSWFENRINEILR